MTRLMSLIRGKLITSKECYFSLILLNDSYHLLIFFFFHNLKCIFLFLQHGFNFTFFFVVFSFRCAEILLFSREVN